MQTSVRLADYDKGARKALRQGMCVCVACDTFACLTQDANSIVPESRLCPSCQQEAVMSGAELKALETETEQPSEEAEKEEVEA